MQPVFTRDGQDTTARCSNLVLANAPPGRVLVTGSGNVVTVSNVTTTQLGYVRGVTGPVHTQLASAVPSGLTQQRVLISQANGNLTVSDVTTTELGTLRGLTGPIQTQLSSAGTQVVSIPFSWRTNGLMLAESPLTFTPLPNKTYEVDAQLLVYANATDHTSSYGVRWPSPLANANAGSVVMSYQQTQDTSTFVRASAGVTDPLCVMQASSLANVPWLLSIRATFTTATAATITPFTILANTNHRSRWAHVLYGSHLSIRNVQ